MIFRPFIPLALLATACVQDPTIPKLGNRTIELRVQVSTQQLAQGQADTISIVAVNHLPDQVRILFNSTCQILVYVRTKAGEAVIPESGEYECIPVASQMVIAGNGTVTKTFIWKGGTAFDPPGSPTRLPPGDYFVSANMDADGFSVPAFAVKVTLLP
jgi:hypothetical protein